MEQALDRHREIRHLVITCNQRARWRNSACDIRTGLLRSGAGRCGERPRPCHDQFVHNMVLAGQCVGHLEDHAQFGEVVAQLCETGRRFLPVAAEAVAAITLLGCTRTCFVGAGVLRAVADESALKVVELSGGKVTTLAETPLGLRHGPLSSVDGQTLFVAFLSSEPAAWLRT